MSDLYPAGVTGRDFEEDTSRPSYQYRNGLTELEQQRLCLEWLEDKEKHADFEDWRLERPQTKAWISLVQEWCEKQDGFWVWLEEGYGA